METIKKSDITHYDFLKRDPRDFSLRWKDEGSFYWRLSASKEATTSSEHLDDFARDPYLIIRRNVAKNPSTSEKTLARLASDSDDRTRLFVAQNPKTSADILEYLLRGGADVYMYRNIAVHPNATGSILARLAKYDDVIVRYNVARHRNTIKNTLSNLLEDSSESVRNMAKKKLEEMMRTAATPSSKKNVKPANNYCSKGVFM